jgi:hypothetical protein
LPDQLVPTRSSVVTRAAVKAGAAVVAVAASTALALGMSVPAAHAVTQTPAQAVTQPSGPPVGPVKISPLGHPRLCWMAWGNGSPITLESCHTTLQGEQWTFTGSILMNGNGYCLQNGGSAQPGSPARDSLYLSFSGQCAGSAARQNWTFGGATGAIENPPGHLCAYVQGGALVPGATITGRPCGQAGSPPKWSQGTSALTLARAHPDAAAAGPPGPGGTTGTGRAFTARVAVSNAPKAMTAYAATVSVRAPAGLTVTRLTGTDALSGWTCQVRELRCRGNLPGDSSGTITIAGTASTSRPASAARDAISAHAIVAGTNQAPHAKLTATTPFRLYTPTTPATPAASAHGTPSGGIVTFSAIAAVLLVALGTVLAFIGRRRRQQPPAPHTEPAPEQ